MIYDLVNIGQLSWLHLEILNSALFERLDQQFPLEPLDNHQLVRKTSNIEKNVISLPNLIDIRNSSEVTPNHIEFAETSRLVDEKVPSILYFEISGRLIVHYCI